MEVGMKASISLADLYDFIFDRWYLKQRTLHIFNTYVSVRPRLRAVRQDLTLQQTEDVQILAACVRCCST